MSNLIERYIHEVGRSLPRKERADIEAELRSLIYDRLDDRFGAQPTDADIAAVLKDLGDPRKMSASYRREQYLIGPDIYPYMVRTLWYVGVTVPVLAGFLHIFDALTAAQPVDAATFIIELLGSVLYTTFITAALVVLGFAIGQRFLAEIAPAPATFEPITLPAIDDPRRVERIDAFVGIVLGVIVLLAILYFLVVGGLTLRFDLDNPGDVLPVPQGWLVTMLGAVTGITAIHLYALRRGRWTAALWLIETLLELLGMVCLYFVLYIPVAQRIAEAVPSVADAMQSLPEIIVILNALFTLLGRGNRLVRLWNYRDDITPVAST